METMIRRLLASRKTIYLTAFAAALFFVATGWVIFFANASGLSFLLFFFAVLSTTLSWVVFVWQNTNVVKRQISTSITQALTKQTQELEKALHMEIDEFTERQLVEYKAQSLNSLIKLEQLRVNLSAKTEGSYDD